MNKYDGTEDDDGVQAFRDMTAAMGQLGIVLEAVDRRQQLRLTGEAAEASEARTAAIEADMAARKALEAAETALQAAKTQVRTSVTWAGLSGLLVALVAICGGYWLGRASGWELGQATGYAEARSEIAAAAWANTPSGRRALFLDQKGSLAIVATCSGPNWHVETQKEGRACFPESTGTAKQTGWFIP